MSTEEQVYRLGRHLRKAIEEFCEIECIYGEPVFTAIVDADSNEFQLLARTPSHEVAIVGSLSVKDLSCL